MTAGSGLHLARSAALVLRVLNGRACSLDLVRAGYRSLSTGGEHSSQELIAGEDLLVRLGVLLRTSVMLRPATESELALHALPEEAAVDVLRRFSNSLPAERGSKPFIDFLAMLGAAGEEAVVNACREELSSTGAPNLAQSVRRVSLESDHHGYDVLAPRVGHAPRLLEVKTQIGHSPSAFRFHLTRNEYDVGRDEPNWSLVVCTAAAGDLHDIQIGGWCSADALRPYLPNDGNGRWLEALVILPKSTLRDGMPSAIVE